MAEHRTRYAFARRALNPATGMPDVIESVTMALRCSVIGRIRDSRTRCQSSCPPDWSARNPPGPVQAARVSICATIAVVLGGLVGVLKADMSRGQQGVIAGIGFPGAGAVMELKSGALSQCARLSVLARNHWSSPSRRDWRMIS
jgi:hypothetical protein